jgi:Lhr-like helicase
MITSDEEQQAAFQRYAEASRKAQATLSFEDGRAAAEAWVGFLNTYLPEDQRLPERRTTGGNVAIFPVHKTSFPGHHV